MHFERVVGGVAGQDRDVDPASDRLVHGKAEAAVGLVEVLGAVVEV
jgi:hypothetical protein